jgi:hypothetical protein
MRESREHGIRKQWIQIQGNQLWEKREKWRRLYHNDDNMAIFHI